jgi:hypothetical protein
MPCLAGLRRPRTAFPACPQPGHRSAVRITRAGTRNIRTADSKPGQDAPPKFPAEHRAPDNPAPPDPPPPGAHQPGTPPLRPSQRPGCAARTHRGSWAATSHIALSFRAIQGAGQATRAWPARWSRSGRRPGPVRAKSRRTGCCGSGGRGWRPGPGGYWRRVRRLVRRLMQERAQHADRMLPPRVGEMVAVACPPTTCAAATRPS